VTVAGDHEERSQGRVVEREGDALGTFGQRDPAEDGAQEGRVPEQGEVHFAAGEAVEAAEEVLGAFHGRWVSALVNHLPSVNLRTSPGG